MIESTCDVGLMQQARAPHRVARRGELEHEPVWPGTDARQPDMAAHALAEWGQQSVRPYAFGVLHWPGNR